MAQIKHGETCGDTSHCQRFYGIGRFITVFISVSVPVLSQMNPVHTLSSSFTALKAAVILLLCVKLKSFIQDLVMDFQMSELSFLL